MGVESNGRHTSPEPRKVHLVGVLSFRGGAGKTMIAANLSYLLARRGSKVAVVDVDLQAPALHGVLNVGPKRILHSVSEFVKGQCELNEVPIDLSRDVGLENGGSLYFLPASTDTQTVTSILLEGYDVGRLNEHLLRVARELDVDYMVLDTHMGINRETLLSLAICDTVLVVLRPDGLDHQGAAVLAHLARKLDVPACLLVPNMVADGSDLEQVSADVEREIGAPTAGVLSWCQELWNLKCPSLFASSSPDHPFTASLERVFERLLSVAEAPSPGGGS